MGSTRARGAHPNKAKGPAETAISPDHGPNNPHQETSVNTQSNTTAPGRPASRDVWFGRACASDDALRHIGIIALAASYALTQNASRKGTTADFAITESALNEATAFLRAIEDIVAQARRDA